MDESSTSIAEQRHVYEEFFCEGDLMKKDFEDGERCVIICRKWFNQWKAHIVGQGDSPGPIDFTRITTDGKLNDYLTLGPDIVAVHESLFDEFLKWYGMLGKKSDVPYRKLYENQDGELTFDVYPPVLHFKSPDKLQEFVLECNAGQTIGDLKSVIRDRNNLKPDVQIVLYDADMKDELPSDDRTTLKECSLDGEKYIEYSVTSKSSRFSGSANGDGFACSYPEGVCGLNNLGNTCFMNSAIQCIASVRPLCEFVLSDDFPKHINRQNKLGSGGELASAFRDLIYQMWKRGSIGGTCVPRDLKVAIAKKAPQFAGFQQQDAQELMNFLLDLLNEDLNKVKDKPYIEIKDADGRPDDVVAEEAWSNFKKRNDSVIVDLFYGLLKSTVICPGCKFVSVTFDPFNSLSLPLDPPLRTVTVWPLKILKMHLTPKPKAQDIVRALKRHLPLESGHEYIVTVEEDQGLRKIPPDSTEALNTSSVLVFDLKAGPHVEVNVHVKGTLKGQSFLMNFEGDKSRLTPESILEAVKNLLCSVSPECGERFQQFMESESVEVTDLGGNGDEERPICIAIPEPIRVPQAEEKRFGLSLADCVDLFLTYEQLNEDNMWYCKQCKKHMLGLKKFDIWTLPQVLVIHLKRYKSAYRFIKNDALVEFPERDFKMPCLNDSKVYNLVAISNHMGSLGGGHYTAYGKRQGTWYHFNDSYVSKASTSIVSSAAYILVYMVENPHINGYS